MGERRSPLDNVSGPVLIILAAGRARRFGGVKPLAPIGPHPEAVIDLVASDAVAAGVSQIVVVVNPDSGSQIESHIASTWPSSVNVSFAVQERSLGTVSAVLAATDEVDHHLPFAVVNADDLYGIEALTLIASHLRERATNALVGFRLQNAICGLEPVTRGLCTASEGRLTTITERRQVVATTTGFISGDGLDPSYLDPDALVSMNLWGFAPSMWKVFEAAMREATNASEDAEVLLPEIVGQVINGHFELPDSCRDFEVLATDSRCIGVTHPGDLDVVRADLTQQIERGGRPAGLFGVAT